MRIVVTGWAFASPFGSEVEHFWDGVCQGPTPVSTWTSEPGFPGLTCLAAQLPSPLTPPLAEADWHPVTAAAAELSARALADAGFKSAPAGAGLALGSVWGESDFLAMPRREPPPAMLPALADALSLDGPVIATPMACAAGNAAIAWAVERLRSGDAPLMLAGGLDLVGPSAVGSYCYLDTLTQELPRPFDADREGFLIADGGGIFVLEPLENALKAGRRVLAEIVGIGGGHDASHPTRPAPDGRGLQLAMRRALADAGLEPAQIGYLNAHSPGTAANDLAEAAAVTAVFGERGVPVSSTKGALGHAQGGANALEALACMLALARQAAPPTLNLAKPDSGVASLDLIIGEPRPLATQYTLSLASSMGGATCALIFAGGPAWV